MNSDEHPKVANFVRLISVGLALLAGSGCGQQQDAKFENSRYSALGEVMAAKVNELARGKDRLVLVIAESDNNQPTALGQTIAAFRKTLDKSFQASVESVVTPAVVFSGSEPLSADKFTALLQKHADADYLVSFFGVPVLTPAQMDQLPSPRPQVVEVVAFNPPTKTMFAKKVICLAALNKPAAQGADATGSSLEIFDSCYQLVTPETAVSLPR
jgi:hypothetical protein